MFSEGFLQSYFWVCAHLESDRVWNLVAVDWRVAVLACGSIMRVVSKIKPGGTHFKGFMGGALLVSQAHSKRPLTELICNAPK